MAKRRPRMRQRIEMLRQQGQLPAAIARYVHNACDTCWSKKIPWTFAELEELERLDREAIARRTERAKEAAEAAARHAEWLASRPPPPPNLGREGFSPNDVREYLGCTVTELNRWAEDGRLPPDGQRFYYGVGNGAKKLWGRAWHFETIANAKPHVDEWRAHDVETDRCWRSQAALFELVQSEYPDAEPQWSPDWLGRQSVDIYIPSINAAIEYQGRQHYEPVACFRGEEGFRKQQERDARKRKLLARYGVTLLEWWYDTPIDDAELERALSFVKPRDDLT